MTWSPYRLVSFFEIPASSADFLTLRLLKQPLPRRRERIAQHRGDEDLFHFRAAHLNAALHIERIFPAQTRESFDANENGPRAREPHTHRGTWQRIRVSPAGREMRFREIEQLVVNRAEARRGF